MALLNSKLELIYYPLSIPSWTCGHCRQGTLIQSGDRVEHRTPQLVKERNHPEWEPDWHQDYFAIFYECSHCSKGSVASGQVRLTPDYDPDIDGTGWFTCYDFQSFTVAPAIVRVEADIPSEVNVRLQAAFSHYWTCLLYTSPSPRDRTRSRMPSSA